MKKSEIICLTGIVVAAVCYSSFPFAILLNPPFTFHGLVSELSEIGQPYADWFNSSDVVSSVLASAIFIYLRIKQRHLPKYLSWALWLALAATLGDIAAAIFQLPANFSASPDINFTTVSKNPIVIIHGVSSFLNSAAFVVSALVWSLKTKQTRYNWRKFIALSALAVGTLGAVTAVMYPSAGALLQRIFIMGYSIWLVALVWDIIHVKNNHKN